MPELPRGCEVTSLAMLLQHAGVKVDKLTLAKQIKKTPYYTGGGYKGNPHEGFVGDMYDFNKPGFGVYEEPIHELANHYMPNRIHSLTNKNESFLFHQIDKGIPVWVITNDRFKHLPPSEFQQWKTKQGEFPLTFREHSVLITGYDNNFVYINDPLYTRENRKVDKEEFIASWYQMGKQALTYLPLN